LKKRILALNLVFLLLAISSWAQPSSSKNAGITMVHLYYNVRDVEANKKFWIMLGATPVVIGKMEALKFPNALIILHQAESSGGTEGSVINHVGFRMPNLPQLQTKMKDAGYKVNGSDIVGNVFTPEDERIELLQEGTEHMELFFDDGQKLKQPKMTAPILLHHIHLYTPVGSVSEVQAWYIRNFGGMPLNRWHHYEVVYLPNVEVELDLLAVPNKVAPTKGRNLDHIGFEIKNLKTLCRKLQANGVKFDIPYKKLPSGLATASLTDPWGTSIELTEAQD